MKCPTRPRAAPFKMRKSHSAHIPSSSLPKTFTGLSPDCQYYTHTVQLDCILSSSCDRALRLAVLALKCTAWDITATWLIKLLDSFWRRCINWIHAAHELAYNRENLVCMYTHCKKQGVILRQIQPTHWHTFPTPALRTTGVDLSTTSSAMASIFTPELDSSRRSG